MTNKVITEEQFDHFLDVAKETIEADLDLLREKLWDMFDGLKDDVVGLK